MSETTATKKMERGACYLLEAGICFTMTFGRPLLSLCIPFLKYYYLVDLLVYTASAKLLHDDDDKMREQRAVIFGSRLLRNIAQYTAAILGGQYFAAANNFSNQVNWTLALGVTKAVIELGYDWANSALDDHYNGYNCPCGHTILGQ